MAIAHHNHSTDPNRTIFNQGPPASRAFTTMGYLILPRSISYKGAHMRLSFSFGLVFYCSITFTVLLLPSSSPSSSLVMRKSVRGPFTSVVVRGDSVPSGHGETLFASPFFSFENSNKKGKVGRRFLLAICLPSPAARTRWWGGLTPLCHVDEKHHEEKKHYI